MVGSDGDDVLDGDHDEDDDNDNTNGVGWTLQGFVASEQDLPASNNSWTLGGKMKIIIWYKYKHKYKHKYKYKY